MLDTGSKFCPLPDLAFIEVRGSDAQAFLHAQLSLDIMTLRSDRAPLAGWHDPKGRLRALMRVLRLAESWLLIAPHSTADSIIQQLQMYVLRSDVSLARASDFEAVAVIDESRDWLAGLDVALGTAADAMIETQGIYWLRLGSQLLHLVGPTGPIADRVAGREMSPTERAELAEIQLGIPSLDHGLAGQFLPQMLNLDRIGAISFDKGCYPGQEVIARIHNLGSVKRRMRRFELASGGEPAAGAPVHDAHGSVVGQVIRAAQADGRTELLAVVQLDTLTQPLYVIDNPLSELPLPYETTDPSV